MRRGPSSLPPGWATLAAVALSRAEKVVASWPARSGNPRLLKMEVRRGRGRLDLLWLMQPEDPELVGRLRVMGQQLALTSIKTCEVCGRPVPRRWPREDVFCEDHEIPF